MRRDVVPKLPDETWSRCSILSQTRRGREGCETRRGPATPRRDVVLKIQDNTWSRNEGNEDAGDTELLPGENVVKCTCCNANVSESINAFDWTKM